MAGLPPARAAADPRARATARHPARDRRALDGRARRDGLRRAAAARVPRRGVVLRRPAPARHAGLWLGLFSVTRTTRRRLGRPADDRDGWREHDPTALLPALPGSRCSSPPATGAPARSRTAAATSIRPRSRSGARPARSSAARGRSASRSGPTSTAPASTTGRTGSASCTARCRCSSARSAGKTARDARLHLPGLHRDGVLRELALPDVLDGTGLRLGAAHARRARPAAAALRERRAGRVQLGGAGGGALCESCGLTRTRPADASRGLEQFAEAEAAKRRLLFELGELGLFGGAPDGLPARFRPALERAEPVTTGPRRRADHARPRRGRRRPPRAAARADARAVPHRARPLPARDRALLLADPGRRRRE